MLVKRVKPWDWLLIIGLCLAPMTGFRIWKIGLGELLCFVWGGIKQLLQCKIVSGRIARFFVAFWLLLILGSIVGYFVAPNELDISGIIVWFFLGVISMIIYQGLKENSLEYNEFFLETYATTAVFWFLFLFVYSKTISKSLFGVSLWYSARRFAGGATNPHQLAVLLCGLTFVFMRNVIKKRKKVINAFLFISSCFLVYQTLSSTGIAAIALTLVFAIAFRFADLFITSREKVIGGFLVLIIPLLILLFPSIFKLFMGWVAKDPNGMGRFTIYSTYPITFFKSPLLGLGPGVHAMDGYIEFHSTYTEILAATGIIGGIVFCVYSIRFFKDTIYEDWTLFPIVLALYSYGLGGFAMRRLVYWGLISIVTVIVEQRKSLIYERRVLRK